MFVQVRRVLCYRKYNEDEDVREVSERVKYAGMVDKPHTSSDHSGDQPCDISGDSSST